MSLYPPYLSFVELNLSHSKYKFFLIDVGFIRFYEDVKGIHARNRPVFRIFRKLLSFGGVRSFISRRSQQVDRNLSHTHAAFYCGIYVMSI
jgi:hypothetical protein